MSHAADIRTSRQPRVSQARLWLVLLLPPMAWLAQTFTSGLIASSYCGGGRQGVARIAMLIIAAVALVTSGTATFSAYGAWQAVVSQGLLTSEGYDREELMALGSLFLGLVFTVAVMWTGLPPAVLSNICGIQR
jgi:hypothetical protein